MTTDQHQYHREVTSTHLLDCLNYTNKLLINSEMERWVPEYVSRRCRYLRNEIHQFWAQNKLKHFRYYLTSANNQIMNFRPFLSTYFIHSTGKEIKEYSPTEFRKGFYNELLDIFILAEEYTAMQSKIHQSLRQVVSSPTVTKELEKIITRLWNHKTIAELEDIYKGMEVLNA